MGRANDASQEQNQARGRLIFAKIYDCGTTSGTGVSNTGRLNVSRPSESKYSNNNARIYYCHALEIGIDMAETILLVIIQIEKEKNQILTSCFHRKCSYLRFLITCIWSGTIKLS